MTELIETGKAAKRASRAVALLTTEEKNRALCSIADALTRNADRWLAANAEDLADAEKSGMSESLLDRLRLTRERIDKIADGVRAAAALTDPVGETIKEWSRPNGLHITKRRVPLGVFAIIYEARPNVTVDAAALCLKSGNACILRGGREAIRSNICAVKIMRETLASVGVDENAVSLVEDTSRESARALMHLNDYVDVLIPRGGRGLIRSVVNEASVPVIRTGEGVCHVYVESEADIRMASDILRNAKCSRPSVCNAAECVVLDKAIAEAFLNEAMGWMDEAHLELRGDGKICNILGTRVKEATEEDWDTEYGDLILAVKTVRGIDEAIEFISEHTTGHSEVIITENAEKAARFMNEIDAAAVYHNASTRFTDGGEFGFGAEIGISTQKLHARGPMGLEELTSWKYLVEGKGQVR
ncbi:MAG: glutamate-5-semialdehyde dehydrogenase [Oscillospiraceae bacterium]|nr:glutamate-5-semialdehyde dehydrogenase [Oscillospiraceae bacterium]